MFFVLALTSVFSLVVIARYAVISFSEPASAVSTSTRRELTKNTIESVHRGSILDRNGKPLAVATNFYHFGVTPSAVEQKNSKLFAHTVAPILNEKESTILRILEDNKDASFVYLKKKIDQSTYDELKRACDRSGYNSSVVRFDRIPGRVYPENGLASQLVGFMVAVANALAGIEYSM